MRISDWSSDVCSSEVFEVERNTQRFIHSALYTSPNHPERKRRGRYPGQSELRARRGRVYRGEASERVSDRRGCTALPCRRGFRGRYAIDLDSDRKSGGEGKRGSVRGNLGG